MKYIKSFNDKETRKIYNGKFSKRIPQIIAKKAYIKLVMIDNAKDINDLRSPPSNHLEKLVGDRVGQYSIAINSQWRICFECSHGYFHKVEIVDYH